MPTKRATLFGAVLVTIVAGTIYFFTCARAQRQLGIGIFAA